MLNLICIHLTLSIRHTVLLSIFSCHSIQDIISYTMFITSRHICIDEVFYLHSFYFSITEFDRIAQNKLTSSLIHGIISTGRSSLKRKKKKRTNTKKLNKQQRWNKPPSVLSNIQQIQQFTAFYCNVI